MLTSPLLVPLVPCSPCLQSAFWWTLRRRRGKYARLVAWSVIVHGVLMMLGRQVVGTSTALADSRCRCSLAFSIFFPSLTRPFFC